MKHFILYFLAYFFSINCLFSQNETITVNQKINPPKLLVGIDIAKYVGTVFNSVPIAVRYNIKSRFTNRVTAILYAGYDNYEQKLYYFGNNPTKISSPYQSEGFYINAGLDYTFNYTPNKKGAWITGLSLIYTNFYDRTSFSLAGNFFNNYTKEVKREFSDFGVEFRLGHLYQATNHFYLYGGMRITGLDIIAKPPFVYMPHYVPGKGLSAFNVELKIFYKLF